MRRYRIAAVATLLLAAITFPTAGLAATSGGPNDPTNIEPDCYVPDVGTVETALGIQSSVDEVCFDTPQLVDREHMKFYTVDLRISGVDSTTWGPGFSCGYFPEPGCGHSQAAYENVGVTLWFPLNWENGRNKTLVQYHFSGGFSSLEGERLIGLGAIQQGMAYAAHDGLTDGAEGFLVDGGELVPLVSSAMTRDVGSVASDWLDRYTDRAPDLRYISGFSFGGWVMTGLMAGNFFGIDMGNNHVDPNDLDSEPFYDAALYMGSDGGPIEFSPTVPGPTATVIPSIFLEGEQDGFLSLRVVASWLDLVDEDEADDFFALWSLRGEIHQPAENVVYLFGAEIDQDLRGPVAAAAIASLHRAVTKGRSMTTYLGGEIVPREVGDPEGDDCFFGPGGPDPDRRVRWHTVDGDTTHEMLIKLHSGDVDVFGGVPMLEPCKAVIDALERIQDVLKPEPAILTPLAANRLGPHATFNINDLIPGEQIDVCAAYGDLEGYVDALAATAEDLQDMGVWKPLRGGNGTRVSDVFDPPFNPFPEPFPGIIGTFEEQGCA